MANPLTYANSDEYVLVNPSDPKVGHLVYDAPMVDAETKQFIRDPETGKIKVYRMVIWGTKGLTQAQVEALITQKNATLVTRINNLDSTLTNFLDADDTSLDQLSELVAAIKANKIDIASLVTDIGKLIDPVSHLPIEATTASVGAVQLATATDIENGTANKVVDAKELINFAQTLPAVNGITDVSSGDNSNQLVVSRIGGSKTLTIDNVEHAGTATSADSVAWDNVSGKPTKVSQFTNDSGYITTDGAAYPRSVGGVTMNFDWRGQDGQPTWLWGGEDGTNMYVYNPANFSVNYANSAGNADTVDGLHEYSFLRNRGSTATNGEDTLWSQIGIKEYYNALPDGLSDVYSWGEVVSLAGANVRFDIYCSHNSSNGDGLYYRSGWDNDKRDWRRFIDSANIGSQSVNYANSAGSVAWGNVSDRPTAVSSFTNDSGYITSAGSCNYANSAGNADTVDGSHAWQMQTLSADGNVHGGAWQLQCQHNVDGDSYFKLYCGDKSVGTKVDRASSAGWADSAGSANTVAWSNVSGRPDIWIG